MAEKRYKISPPIGTIIVPKAIMTEKDVREFAPQIVQDPEVKSEVWLEKIAKDSIEDVVDWLRSAGYIVTEL